jgi:hypothetical protein
VGERARVTLLASTQSRAQNIELDVLKDVCPLFCTLGATLAFCVELGGEREAGWMGWKFFVLGSTRMDHVSGPTGVAATSQLARLDGATRISPPTCHTWTWGRRRLSLWRTDAAVPRETNTTNPRV